MTANQLMIDVSGVEKAFTLHNQGGASFGVLDNASLQVQAGECVVLHGQSGAGKSTFLKALYANYSVDGGEIRLRDGEQMVEITSALPRRIIALRRQALGYVSQFLRVIPRVSTLEVVMQPLLDLGVDAALCEAKAKHLLQRLNVPERLWSLAPGTFSGGEQQRVNIARGFIVDYPILLLDEPTASLDAANRKVVVELIREAKDRGAAIVGIFHDEDVREAVADRLVDIKAI
ncbi:phosphonate C-P lyase system protein PhnL [Marinobacterium stanieri]|uniref:Methylphosphonate degradation complex, subunit phnL n=1 Tax=Marinobacterium stanieri TaxID=49186 RepID=A0A1N6S507_9GAMM|nr:phosphonate C-P lyase system protein PhnL [Marinobacterium stanieri]SIQ36052.1 methylphosphonate degradation complex, subunit phnL [Marinobacterium stanieri]